MALPKKMFSLKDKQREQVEEENTPKERAEKTVDEIVKKKFKHIKLKKDKVKTKVEKEDKKIKVKK